MSEKSDQRFFNHFAVIIILLHGIVIALFVLARVVAGHTQKDYVGQERETRAAIDLRTAPFARVAVAGQDNSALAIEEKSSPAGAKGGAAQAQQATLELSGEETFKTACQTCHGTGVAGAPRVGDAADWGPRIAQGKKTLYDHAIHGFQGRKGVMPAKGGRPDLTDSSVMKAVDYMASEAR